MRSPFHSETEAFRFLLLTVVAFAAVALASLLGGPWLGVPVWIAVTVAAALVYLRSGRGRRVLRTAPAHAGGPDEWRVLVVANETLASPQLVEEIEKAATGARPSVLVVCPALTSAVRRWASDVDGGRARAKQRLEESLDLLREAGIEAQGEIGDDDPLVAIEDALRTFVADEIVIATHPAEQETWLERGLVERTRERFALPIVHVVIEAETVSSAGV
jgi:GABA permease